MTRSVRALEALVLGIFPGAHVQKRIEFRDAIPYVSREPYFRELLREAERQGFSAGWAHFEYLEQFGERPRRCWLDPVRPEIDQEGRAQAQSSENSRVCSGVQDG